MESLIEFLFGMAVIATICVMLIENPFLFFSFAFFIFTIAGGIYAVGKALGETSKFKNEVDKKEIAND